MIDESHMCLTCGVRRGRHRCSDGACPPRSKPFPKFPDRVEKARGMAAAQEVYGQRLDRYWAKSPGKFRAA